MRLLVPVCWMRGHRELARDLTTGESLCGRCGRWHREAPGPSEPVMYGHAGDCMCMVCAAERQTYCSLTRDAEDHQNHLIPTCPAVRSSPVEGIRDV